VTKKKKFADFVPKKAEEEKAPEKRGNRGVS
jgi:hypothetical protein